MGTFISIDERAFLQAQEALRAFQQPNMDKVLRKAVTAGANAYRAPLRAATPVKRDALRGKQGGGYGAPGDLRDSIRQRRVRADGFGISAVVGPMGKKAFTRHWVTKGTKPHQIAARAQARREGVSLRQAAAAVMAGKRHTLRLPDGNFRTVVQHRGARANPYIARVGAANRQRSRDAMVRVIVRAAKKEQG
jgi:hypothetical protein